MTPEQKNKALVMLWSENFNNDFEISKNKDILKVYNIEQSEKEIENLILRGQSFDVTSTAMSVKIKVYERFKTREIWYLENTKSEYFLILLNKIKRDIKRNAVNVLKCSFSPNINDIKYFGFSTQLNELAKDAGSVYEIKEGYEADISHAYHRAGYVLRFIERETYEEIIKNLSKEERLRLLGCIATVKTFESYKKGKMTDQHSNIKDLDVQLFRATWFKICHYVDTAILKLKTLLGNDFLFYWVDGIYFKHTILKDPLKELKFWRNIHHINEEFDVEFKIVPLPRFEILNRYSYIEINVYKPDGKMKRFFPEKKQIKEYSIIGLNELQTC